MKIIILSPNTDTLFSKDHMSQLEAAGDPTIVKDIKPFKEVAELYQGDEPRIVAIDPDFSNWSLPNDVIDAIPNLKAICLQTTSFSWLDVEHCKQKGIPVTDLRGFSSIAVAEWLVFMTLAVARHVPLIAKDGWKVDYEKHRGFELRGKTAGIVGLGNIGMAAAENLSGLGMNVQYWSRHSEDSRFKKVSLEEVVKTSDVIAITVASNPETKGLIEDDLLKTMKPTAVLVNITDHAIYNHDFLLKMAAEGKIGGYAFEDEVPLGKYEGNVWNGPELAWCTDESMTKNGQQWVESIVKAVKGDYPTKVN